MVKRNALHRFIAWVAVLVPIVSFAQNNAQIPNCAWHGSWHMMPGSAWGFGWIFPFLMMVFMVLFCVFLMRLVMRRGHFGHFHGDETSSAVRLLNERFARGEIPKEEYEEKLATLARSR
jgi:putative membrane protein